jgi:hypothetical protein
MRKIQKLFRKLREDFGNYIATEKTETSKWLHNLENDYEKQRSFNIYISFFFACLILYIEIVYIFDYSKNPSLIIETSKNILTLALDKFVSSNWSDFLSNLLATLIGAFIGIFTALWVDRIIKSRNQIEQKKILFTKLRDNLTLNFKILENTENNIKELKIDSYHMDTHVLEISSLLRSELITNMDLIRSLDKVSYHLERTQKSLDRISDIAIQLVSGKNIDIAKDITNSYKDLLLSTIPGIKKEINYSLELIMKELNNIHFYFFYEILTFIVRKLPFYKKRS